MSTELVHFDTATIANINREAWFQQLIEDCKDIIVESEFTARWALVEGYHVLGKRILQDYEKFQRIRMPDSELVQCIAVSLNKSKRTVYQAIQFARLYPDLNLLPEGKNTSWYKICNQYLLRKVAHVSYNTGENEWYTPVVYIEAVRAVMGSIDVDPASSDIANQVVEATVYYTVEDDGRLQSWQGNVWMNPPYAQPLISEFCELLIKKYLVGEVKQACVLVNNATETVFYQNMLKVCGAVCFIKGRVRFIDEQGKESGAPLQGQTILYFGERIAEFATMFEVFGVILYGDSTKRRNSIPQ